MLNHDDYNDKWKTNRQKKLIYKSGLFWCWGCDRDYVNDWKKCDVCGTRNNKRRNKRDKNEKF